jgi:hypothetical protein
LPELDGRYRLAFNDGHSTSPTSSALRDRKDFCDEISEGGFTRRSGESRCSNEDHSAIRASTGSTITRCKCPPQVTVIVIRRPSASILKTGRSFRSFRQQIAPSGAENGVTTKRACMTRSAKALGGMQVCLPRVHRSNQGAWSGNMILLTRNSSPPENAHRYYELATHEQ